MFRKTLIALTVATIATALVSTDASAQRGFGGFRGGGFHAVLGGGVGGGGGGGGVGGGVFGGGAPGAVGMGVGFGIACAAAWGPGWGWGGPGWGYAGPGWGYAGPGWGYAGGGCTQLQQVWTGWGWRVVPVTVC